VITYAVIILGVVVGTIFLVAILAQFAGGSSRTWKALAERYPSTQADPINEVRTANIFLSATDDPKGVLKPRGCLFVGFGWFAGNRNAQNVRVVIDDYYLHMDLDSGAVGPKLPMSIPWGAVEIGETFETHVGEHAVLSVDEFTLFVPTASIERELLMRQALRETGEQTPFDDADPGSFASREDTY